MFGCAPTELKNDLREYRACHYQSPLEKERSAKICQCGDTCDHVTILLAWRNYFLVAVTPIVLMFACPMLIGALEHNEFKQQESQSTEYNVASMPTRQNTYCRFYQYSPPNYSTSIDEAVDSYYIRTSSQPMKYQLHSYATNQQIEPSGIDYNRTEKYEIDKRRFSSGSAYAFNSSHNPDFGQPRDISTNP